MHNHLRTISKSLGVTVVPVLSFDQSLPMYCLGSLVMRGPTLSSSFMCGKALNAASKPAVRLLLKRPMIIDTKFAV